MVTVLDMAKRQTGAGDADNAPTEQVSVRIDADNLAWMRAHGRAQSYPLSLGYLINVAVAEFRARTEAPPEAKPPAPRKPRK